MEHVNPKDVEIAAYVGRKLKINRGEEEFVGTVRGWSEKGGKRVWVIEAENSSKTFLPSDGWSIYDVTVS